MQKCARQNQSFFHAHPLLSSPLPVGNSYSALRNRVFDIHALAQDYVKGKVGDLVTRKKPALETGRTWKAAQEEAV